MLFDLRGRGRRNTIKVIYVSLAILMGGGLVFFGIGGDVSGGLVDAITERGTAGSDGSDRLRDRETQALAATRRNPRDAAAWAALTRARASLANIGENFDASTNTYTDAGKRKLQGAADAWKRYLSLDPPPEEAAQVAGLIRNAYGPEGLNKPEDAAAAQEVIAEARPTSSNYANFAVLAYEAGQQRKGDLAKDKALELADKDERENLRGQLESAAAQAATQGGASGGQGAPTPAPTPPPG